MATTSITKEFFVKDQKAFERMKRDLDKEVPVHKMVAKSASLKKSKKISYLCISLRAPLARTSEHGQVDRLRCPRFFLVR